jgi:hypothetical protein
MMPEWWSWTALAVLLALAFGVSCWASHGPGGD